MSAYQAVHKEKNNNLKLVNRVSTFFPVISKTGICYLWCAKACPGLLREKNICNKKSLSEQDGSCSKENCSVVATIFAAKWQGNASASSGHIFITFGLLIKLYFQLVRAKMWSPPKERSFCLWVIPWLDLSSHKMPETEISFPFCLSNAINMRTWYVLNDLRSSWSG